MGHKNSFLNWGTTLVLSQTRDWLQLVCQDLSIPQQPVEEAASGQHEGGWVAHQMCLSTSLTVAWPREGEGGLKKTKSDISNTW